MVAVPLFAASTPSDHPNARIDATADGTNLSVEHRAGEPLHEDEFEVVIQETSTTLPGMDGVPLDGWGDKDEYYEPGEIWRFDVAESVPNGASVLLIYTGTDRVLLDQTTIGITVTEDATTTTTSDGTPTTTEETTTTDPTITTTEVPDDNSPVAGAGGNYTVEKNGEVELNGSNSTDPEDDELTYLWTINKTEGTDGKLGSLTDAESERPLYEAPKGEDDGIVYVDLKVTDQDGNSDTDTTAIKIEGSAGQGSSGDAGGRGIGNNP